MNIIARNNVTISGKGDKPMVLAHGFGCDQTMWRHIVPAFEAGYKVILFDYVGCGRSDHSSYDPVRYASLEGYAQDVLDICNALNLQDVVFVGHSVSSMIGILAAKLAPELFRTTIMLGPSACYLNEPGYEGGFEKEELEALVRTIDKGKGWTKTLAPVVMSNPDRPELAEELASLFCQLAPETASQFARITFLSDHRPMLHDHKVPTLVLQCSDDIVAPVSAGEYIRRYIQNSTMVQLKATGHVPQMSAPRETVSAMWDYLYSSLS